MPISSYLLKTICVALHYVSFALFPCVLVTGNYLLFRFSFRISCLKCFGIPWKLVGGRVLYSCIYFLFALICWILRVYSNEILGWMSVISVCDNEERCSGTLAVYRFSFAIAVWSFHCLILFTFDKRCFML